MTLSRRATVTPVVKLRQTGAVKRGGHKPPTCEDGRWRFAGADYKREATKWRCPTGECKPASRWVAKHGRDDSVPARVRIRAAVLRDAIDDFAATISTRFHGARSETTEASLEAYTRDHG